MGAVPFSAPRAPVARGGGPKPLNTRGNDLSAVPSAVMLAPAAADVRLKLLGSGGTDATCGGKGGCGGHGWRPPERTCRRKRPAAVAVVDARAAAIVGDEWWPPVQGDRNAASESPAQAAVA